MVRITSEVSAEMADTIVYRTTLVPSGVRAYSHSRVRVLLIARRLPREGMPTSTSLGFYAPPV
jgi:hypothetical protein